MKDQRSLTFSGCRKRSNRAVELMHYYVMLPVATYDSEDAVGGPEFICWVRGRRERPKCAYSSPDGADTYLRYLPDEELLVEIARPLLYVWEEFGPHITTQQ